MAAGHPDGLPDLFLDRSLGRRQVPAMLRGAGLRLHTLAEVYGVPADQDIVDTVWLQMALYWHAADPRTVTEHTVTARLHVGRLRHTRRLRLLRPRR